MNKIRTWDIMAKELEKCVLVCSNCHSEINAGLVDVPNEAPRYIWSKYTYINHTPQRRILNICVPSC